MGEWIFIFIFIFFHKSIDWLDSRRNANKNGGGSWYGSSLSLMEGKVYLM